MAVRLDGRGLQGRARAGRQDRRREVPARVVRERQEFQARFERETRVMSKLAHPNCVSVLDFGVWKDAPYLVMEYVAGTTLRARIDVGAHTGGAGARDRAPDRGGARARARAGHRPPRHQAREHHDHRRDRHGERVRILDFGLARLRGNVGRDATQTNMVVGTPNYMAPEQTVPAGRSTRGPTSTRSASCCTR